MPGYFSVKIRHFVGDFFLTSNQWQTSCKKTVWLLLSISERLKVTSCKYFLRSSGKPETLKSFESKQVKHDVINETFLSSTSLFDYVKSFRQTFVLI